MLVNNELGTLTDIGAISRIVHDAGALLHVDAAQALGKTPIDVRALGIDMLSMSAHKVYGPKGIGALFVRRDIADQIAPQIHGGGHERGLRSARSRRIRSSAWALHANWPPKARRRSRSNRGARRAPDGRAGRTRRCHAERGRRAIPHAEPDSECAGLLPFMLGEALAVSSTSACNSSSGAPSHVLTAIGLDAETAGRTVRVSFGRFTTEQDVDFAIACFRHAIEQCRATAANGFSASRQITPADLKAIRNAGFRSVICNRPDGEGDAHPAFDEIAAAARELGLEARYLPVERDGIGDAEIDAFGALVDTLQKPVLAYCRSGSRSGMLWSRLSARRTAEAPASV